MKAATRPTKNRHRDALVEGEIDELGQECARVVALLERRAQARSAGRDSSDILGELSAIVLHLHVHTKGLDALIDQLESD